MSKMLQNHGSGVIYSNKFRNEDLNVVFFDLETSGLEPTCDILQIGLKCGGKRFEIYVNPSKPIPGNMKNLNGFSNKGEQMYLHGTPVTSVSPRKALLEMLDFLEELGKPCALVAHNCDFDATRIMRIIQIFNLEEEFSNVIFKFVDTLSLFRSKFPGRRKKGQLTLLTLAKDLLPFAIKFKHNASYDVFMLEQLVFRHFDYNQLMKGAKTFEDYL